MSDLVVTRDLIVDAIMGNAGRCTLPFHDAAGAGGFATAFWYRHVDGDEVTRYLVTAEAATDLDTADWLLRPDLGEPDLSAEHLVMFNFAGKWTRIPQLGIAVLPAAELDTYADGKGWHWTVDEITDGLAARSDDVATTGLTSVPAYVLGHHVGPGKDRTQTVFIGAVAMDLRGKLRWMAPLPEGCAGSPVFMFVPPGGRDVKLVCLGLVLPGDDPCEIIPFDRIRRAITGLSAPQPRRWWRRRGRTPVPAPRSALATEAVPTAGAATAESTSPAENTLPTDGAAAAPFVGRAPGDGRASLTEGTPTTAAVPPEEGSLTSGNPAINGDLTVDDSPTADESPVVDRASHVGGTAAVDVSRLVEDPALDSLAAVDNSATVEQFPTVDSSTGVEVSSAEDGTAPNNG
jgi:hypothetical protein